MLIRKIYWWLFVIYLAMKWIPKYNLCDLVWYRNKKYVLIQEVCSPIWVLSLYRGNEILKVNELEFRKVKTLRNYWGSLKSGYKFYMGYWYDIWVRGEISPWMFFCSIWK